MDIRSATISAGFGFLGILLKSYSENLRRRKTSLRILRYYGNYGRKLILLSDSDLCFLFNKMSTWRWCPKESSRLIFRVRREIFLSLDWCLPPDLQSHTSRVRRQNNTCSTSKRKLLSSFKQRQSILAKEDIKEKHT